MEYRMVAYWYLWITGGVFLVVYALPLLLAPLWWSRVFQWNLPKDTDLAVYLGRCLGAVALATVLLFFRVASSPQFYPIVFELMIVIGILMTLIHVWGAIRRVQPWTETAEIALYGGATVAAIWIYSGL